MNQITKLLKKIKELFTIIPDEVSQITNLIKRKRRLTAQSFFKALIILGIRSMIPLKDDIRCLLNNPNSYNNINH